MGFKIRLSEEAEAQEESSGLLVCQYARYFVVSALYHLIFPKEDLILNLWKVLPNLFLKPVAVLSKKK